MVKMIRIRIAEELPVSRHSGNNTYKTDAYWLPPDILETLKIKLNKGKNGG